MLKETTEHRAMTEEEAVKMIEQAKQEQSAKGYIVGKSSYTRKVKKARGEIVAECYVVSITRIYDEVWSYLE